jgi:glycosyltransferase involved in cell wall biosynthesis
VKHVAGRLRAAARGLVIARSRPAEGEIAVSYGHRRVPAVGDPVEGGMGKIQRLQTAFPNRLRDFNLLYLGSSCLPSDVDAVIALAMRREAPIVLNQDGVAYPAWAGEAWEEKGRRQRRLLDAATHVLYQSVFCKETADRFLGPPPRTWEVLHNAVDTTTFRPRPAPPAGPPVVLLAGDQFQTYRIPTALRAIALLPDARLVITGSLAGGGAELIDELGLRDRVELVGRYAQRDAPALVARAHVLLHPKVNDPCPNVVLEALACGVPVVYAASGGTVELVGDGGIGVASETTWERDVPPAPDALAEAVRAVLDDHDRYREAARSRSLRFDLAPWLDRHRELFVELVER